MNDTTFLSKVHFIILLHCTEICIDTMLENTQYTTELYVEDQVV